MLVKFFTIYRPGKILYTGCIPAVYRPDPGCIQVISVRLKVGLGETNVAQGLTRFLHFPDQNFAAGPQVFENFHFIGSGSKNDPPPYPIWGLSQ